MRVFLGPALTNIIMTQCRKHIVADLIKSEAIKFYVRYFYDEIFKHRVIDYILDGFTIFHPMLLVKILVKIWMVLVVFIPISNSHINMKIKI